MEKKVSIIICAYNEEKTIEEVVRKCREYNSEDTEILVIDDGSEDSTQSIMEKLRNEVEFSYHRMSENQGKSFAMVKGVELSKNEVILFFDADVQNIKKEHFKKLLAPITSDEPEADMVLGTPSDTLINYRINPFKSLTGERAMLKKDIEPILDSIREIRFGVETYINLYFQANGKIIKYVLLEGLLHPVKFDKTSPVKATQEFISEGQEIAITLFRNYDLITKRIGSSFDRQNGRFRETLKDLQDDINDKLQVILRNNG